MGSTSPSESLSSSVPFLKISAGTALAMNRAEATLLGAGLIHVLPDWGAVSAHLFAVTPAEMQPGRVRKLVNFMKDQFATALEEVSRTR